MNNVFGTIKIKKGKRKYCRGYYDLLKRENIPCSSYEDLTDSVYSQCKQCQIKSGFDLCLRCNGSDCNSSSEKARKFCGQEHYVYIAYFANDKLKVGVTAGYRKYERLLEQGAIYSIFVAKTPNGKIARQVENYISSLGIVQKVSVSYKINNILSYKDAKEIKKLLINEYRMVKDKIDKVYEGYLINPEYNNFEKMLNGVKEKFSNSVEQLNLFGESEIQEYITYEKEVDPENVVGENMATIGSILLLKKGDKYIAVNMKKLEGWEVEL